MPQQEIVNWECIADVGAKVGECPLWSTSSKSLFWIDSHAPSLSRMDGQTGVITIWALPETVGCFTFTQDPNVLVVALQNGLATLSLSTGTVSHTHPAPYNSTKYRFNDGRCDAMGRFWVGTMRLPQSAEPDGGAAFYRLDEHGLSLGVSGTTIANGLAWSPDNRTMYIADRPNWRIVAMEYDLASGRASGGRTFARVPEGQYPDGAWVDIEGGYWISLFAGGRILRFLPDGTLDRDIKAPTPQPTMVSFGGEHGTTMFVTTALTGWTGPTDYPQAGGVFRCDLGVKGLPVRVFRCLT